MVFASSGDLSDRGAAALDGCGIVYFGNAWTAENRTSSHHIARRLATRFPLLYVECPGMRPPTTQYRDVRKLWRTLSHTIQAPRRLSEHMWLCTIPQLPFARLPGVPFLNQSFGAAAVRNAIARVGFKRIILWFVVPHPGYLAGRLGEALSVYYCIDDYAAHPGVDQDAIQRADAELTRMADQVFVAPPGLLEAKQQLNPHTLFSPHGVDVDLFAQAILPETPIAPAAASLRHPVVGFFGLLGEWIDVPLLVRIAEAHPEWTLLIVGRVAADVTRLKEHGNVTFVGPQPYEELPQWAKAFDVAVIPYLRNRQVINANPLKLREYLATGKPVVAVSTPEIDRFGDCVRVAADAADFVTKIEEALDRDTPEQQASRMNAVRAMTWDARVEETVGAVGQALRRKNDHAHKDL
ncbi:MAG: glycosyltransferase [Rhodospirillales bacterium]|nr:glycosyltransferase [Rhodospirillales bacterium]